MEPPTRCAIETPESGGSKKLKRSKLGSRDVAITGIFAALYAVLVVGLGFVSFLPQQIRFADALLPLTMLLGWPAIVGVTIGAFVANIFGPFGPIDMVGGSIANLVGCTLAYYASRKLIRFNPYRAFFIGSLLTNLTVTFIVGSYLYLFFLWAVSPLFGLPLLVASWMWIFAGSLVAMNILGITLTTAIYRRSLMSPQIKRLLKL